MFRVQISILLAEGQEAVTDEQIAPFKVVGHPGAWPIYFSYLGQRLEIRSDELPDELPEPLKGLNIRIEVEVNPQKHAKERRRTHSDASMFYGKNLFEGRLLISSSRGYGKTDYQRFLPIIRALSPLIEGENFST